MRRFIHVGVRLIGVSALAVVYAATTWLPGGDGTRFEIDPGQAAVLLRTILARYDHLRPHDVDHDRRPILLRMVIIDEDGDEIERRNPDFELSEEVAGTGCYAFGSNQLRILRALDKVLTHLDRTTV